MDKAFKLFVVVQNGSIDDNLKLNDLTAKTAFTLHQYQFIANI